MATYTVTNTASTGPGSLAAALAAAKNGDTVQFAVGGTITLSGTTALPAGSVFLDTTDALGTAHDVTVGGGALADAAGAQSALAKTGAGTLTLTNTANTYSGGTTLSGGRLNVPIPNPSGQDPTPVTTLGSGAIAFDGGTLSLDDVRLGNSATIDARGGSILLDDDAIGDGYTKAATGEIDGDITTAPGTTAGAFTVAGPANGDDTGLFNFDKGLTLTGADTFAGGLTIQDATVQIGNEETTGTLAGNVTGISTGKGYGALFFSHSADTTTTYAGNIAGNVGVFQDEGITVLAGNDTYVHQTEVSIGILRAGSPGAFSPSSQIFIESGDGGERGVATIDLAGFNEAVGGLIAENVHFSPNENDIVTNSGPHDATLTISAAGPSTPYAAQQNQNYTGYGRIFASIIEDGDPSQGGSKLALDVAGNLNLARASTYTGGTTIERGGTLTLLSEDAAREAGGAHGFGSVVGAITDDGTLAIVAVAYGGAVRPVVVANALSGSGGVTMTVDTLNEGVDGIAILTGHNTYTGATLVDHGTLEGGVANAFGTDSAVTVNGDTFGHGATLDLGGNPQAIGALSGDSGGVVTDGGAAAVLTVGGGDGSGTFLGTLRDGAGALALVKTGAGTETLAGTDSYTGGTTIAAGTLEFASDAALPPGTIAFAGSAATLKLDAAPANGATFADPLSGLAPGDALDLAGLAFAAGATAAVSGNRLAVTSGGTTEYFTLVGAATTAFAVARDAAGGTLVTALVPPTAPVIVGTHDTADAAEATVTPFAGVTVADGNAGATDRLTIALSGGGGALTDPNGALTRNADGSYALAATDPATLSRELDALRFTPANGTPGATAATTLTLAVASSAGTTTTDGGTAVTDTAAPAPVPPPTAPVIVGTHGTADAAEATVTPFAGVTVTDGNAGATDRLTIALAGGGGALTDPNGVLTRNPDGTYALAATDPATLSRELDALRFTPANGTPGATAVTTFTLTVASSAGTAAADGGTAVTDTAAPAPVPPPAPPPAPAPVDSITVDQAIDYDGAGTFTLTGTAFSAVGVRGVEFTAEVDGQADQPVDLGAATVNPDGTFSFTDDVGSRLQGFITATETDDAGLQTQAAFRPALQGGRSPHADRYTVTPTDVTYTGSTCYRADGSHRVTVTASDQAVRSAYKDAFLNDGVPDTTFVFDPGYAHDVVSLFRVDNVDHDTLSFKGSDFGTDPASQLAGVLANSHHEKGGVVITDPTTQETVKLLGISKQQLVQNQQDFTFHA